MIQLDILNLANEVQMFALHFSYLPVIQADLDMFKITHNKMPLRTELSRTPEQLFDLGICQNRRSATAGVADYLHREALLHSNQPVENYGIDSDGPIPEMDSLTTNVELNYLACPVPQAVLEDLKTAIIPVRMYNAKKEMEIYGYVIQFL